MRESQAFKIIDELLTNQLVSETIRLGCEDKAKKHLIKFGHIGRALTALKDGRDDGYVITLSLCIWIDEI